MKMEKIEILDKTIKTVLIAVDKCKTYSIIQFYRLFYKFLPVENKKFNVEN